MGPPSDVPDSPTITPWVLIAFARLLDPPNVPRSTTVNISTAGGVSVSLEVEIVWLSESQPQTIATNSASITLKGCHRCVGFPMIQLRCPGGLLKRCPLERNRFSRGDRGSNQFSHLMFELAQQLFILSVFTMDLRQQVQFSREALYIG